MIAKSCAERGRRTGAMFGLLTGVIVGAIGRHAPALYFAMAAGAVCALFAWYLERGVGESLEGFKGSACFGAVFGTCGGYFGLYALTLLT